MKPQEKLIRVREVAALLGVSRRTVIRWITEQNLPAYKPGGQYLLYLSDVEQWFKEYKYEGNDSNSGGGK